MRGIRLAGAGLMAMSLAAARAGAAPGDLGACSAAFSAAPDLAKAGKLLAARAQLTLCAADPCPASMRALCADDLRHLQDRIPTVVFAAHGPRGADLVDVRVSEGGTVLADKLDGRAVELDPGEHTFRFVDRQGGAGDQTVVVREGQRDRAVSVTLGSAQQPLPPPRAQAPADKAVEQVRPVPWVVYLSGAITLVAAGSFASFGLLGLTERASLSSCKGTCPQPKVNEVSTNFTIADASWITGLVALAVTGVLYFTRPTLTVAASSNNGLLLGF